MCKTSLVPEIHFQHFFVWEGVVSSVMLLQLRKVCCFRLVPVCI